MEALTNVRIVTHSFTRADIPTETAIETIYSYRRSLCVYGRPFVSKLFAYLAITVSRSMFDSEHRIVRESNIETSENRIVRASNIETSDNRIVRASNIESVEKRRNIIEHLSSHIEHRMLIPTGQYETFSACACAHTSCARCVCVSCGVERVQLPILWHGKLVWSESPLRSLSPTAAASITQLHKNKTRRTTRLAFHAIKYSTTSSSHTQRAQEVCAHAHPR